MFDQLKEVIRQHLRNRIPGMYQLLDFLSNVNYRMSCIELLFTSPSRLYLLILQYYRGDQTTCDVVFQMLFINPITSFIRKPELAKTLMEYVKLGKDPEFVDLIKKSLYAHST